jgi:hypothetical protein
VFLVHKELLERKAQQEILVHKVCKALKVHKERKV